MRLTAAFIVLALAAPAAAQDKPTDVSPVTVMPAGDPPKLTASFPAEGMEVTAGLLALKLTFDQPMDPKGWRLADVDAGSPLECLGAPRLLRDEKSFVVLCRTLPGKRYAVALNGPAAPAPDAAAFANLGGRSALPATVTFGTRPRGDDPIRTLKAAMAAAGLSDLDNPVVDTPSVKVGALPQ